MNLKKIFLLFALSLLPLQMIADEIYVLAAASLKFPLDAIKKAYLEAHPNENINISYLGSGKAYAQISNHAPVHLFLSADTSYPQKLYEQKLAPNPPELYAQGALVLWSASKERDLSDILVLKKGDFAHLAIANPKHAPYGRASIQALEKLGLLDLLKPKIVYGESIGQATAYVKNNNAEIGFSALSTIKGMQGEQNYLLVDKNLYSPILQALIITNYGKDSALTKSFKDFVLSKEGALIWQQFGYTLPNK